MPDENKLTIDELGRQMKEGFYDVHQKMQEGFKKVDEKFGEVNEKFGGMDKKFDEMNERFDELALMTKKGFDEVSNNFKAVNIRLDAIEKRLDHIEGDIAALKMRMDSVEEILDKIDRITLVDYRRRIEYLETEVRRLKEMVVSKQAA